LVCLADVEVDCVPKAEELVVLEANIPQVPNMA
jgi:hypothetical protein